jgi:hypothetical protein
MRVRTPSLFVLSAVLLTGCQRLNYEKTFHLEATAVQPIEFSAPTYAQKLTVQVSSPGAPVTVYVVRVVQPEDATAAQTQMETNQAPADPLAGKEKAEEINLETTVPAKTAYMLLIRADKKAAEVRVKVTGR